MATLQSYVDRVTDNVYSSYPAERPFTEYLGTGYTVGATTFDVTDGTQWAIGDNIENYTGNEQMRITGVATNTLTVVRGINGTTAIAGVAGDTLRKNPKITRKMVEDSLTEIMYDLRTHGVYNIDTTTVTVSADTYIYSVTFGELMDPPGILGVYYVDPSTSVLVPVPYQLLREAHTTSLTGGEGLRIPPGSWDGAISTLYVSKAVAYTDITTLPVLLEGPVVLGASGRLLGKMIMPSLVDPGHLTNRTVPPGQAARDARWYQGEYITAVRRIAATLAAETYGLESVRGSRAKRWRR